VAEPHLFRAILPVTDIEAAASFYAQVLRMPGTRVSAGRHYFDCGGTILACYDALADGDPEEVGPNPQYVYFSVDDLDGALERADDAGCRELGDIEVQHGASAASMRVTRSETPSASSTRRRSSPAQVLARPGLSDPIDVRATFPNAGHVRGSCAQH
jgi:predicted enzyme related to lactoylglutathione lyase